MKILNRKRGLYVNLLLFVIIGTVFAISFFPKSIIPIYGGNLYSPIYNGNKNNKNVSVMVNVYENADIVEKMVELFDSYNVKCTFFVGGCWADDNETTLKKIVKSGHELGNHGYFHKDHKKLSYSANYEEIKTTSNIVEALSGVKPILFAPPSGSYCESTLQAAYDFGNKVIMWSKDTIDWRDNDKDKIYKRATNDLTNGDLVLMHPKEHTLNVLPSILDYYLKNDFKVVTVSQNITE